MISCSAIDPLPASPLQGEEKKGAFPFQGEDGDCRKLLPLPERERDGVRVNCLGKYG